MMQVFLPDVRASTLVAMSHPASRTIYAGKTTLSDFGNHALFAIDKRMIEVAHRYLRDASEVEVQARLGCGFVDAFELLNKFIDQAKELRSCPECGAGRGRDCTINSAHGVMARPWIHDARVGRGGAIV